MGVPAVSKARMKARLHGRLSSSAIAVFGVWDPFLPSHRELLDSLRTRARQNGCCSLVVLIDPPPGAFSTFKARYGASGWPEYDSVAARIKLMLDCGIDAVLRMHFRKRDFTATAAEFIDLVRERATLEEIWLGALQLLGPGQLGSHSAITDYAARHGVRLTMLPAPPLLLYDVRHFLAAGRLVDAIAVVGRAPVWERPRSGELRLAWRPGRYRATPVERPGWIDVAPAIDVTLSPSSRGPARLSWPCRNYRYLAFTSGPLDEQPVALRSAHG